MSATRPKVALMQPHFLPWLGYFELVREADLFVVLDDFQFSRQSWSHRNRIITSPGRVGWVTLPIQRPGALTTACNRVRENPEIPWRRKLVATIDHVYGKSPGHDATVRLLEGWFGAEHDSIAELEIDFVVRVCDLTGIRADIVRSSELGVPRAERSSHVADILRAVDASTYLCAHGSFDYMAEDGLFPLHDIGVRFQDFTPQPYPQPGVVDFEPRLSVIDALAGLGPDQLASFTHGTDRWLSWEERAERSSVLGATGN